MDFDAIRSVRSNPWVISALAAATFWVLIQAFGQVGSGMSVLTVSMQFAAFYVIVGVAQMLVISIGPGNIDLSIPSTMVLSAFVSMAVMAGSDNNLVLGLLAGLGVGIPAGLFNIVLIQFLAIPPMIATLASGFILQSVAAASSSLFGAKPSPLIGEIMSWKLAGIPALAIFALIVTAVCAWALQNTRAGRSVLAIGQNPRAAFLAGYNVKLASAVVYLLSAMMASICGMALAVFSGGAALNMANDFILMSIAVVVLGGTSVAGGRAVPIGLWASAILLQNLVIFLNVIGAPNGIRHAATGLIILLVLALTGKPIR